MGLIHLIREVAQILVEMRRRFAGNEPEKPGIGLF